MGVTKYHTFYPRDRQELLRNQLFFATDYQVVLRHCVKGSLRDHPLQILFWNDVYKSIRNHVQRPAGRNAFWNSCIAGNQSSFVRMVQVCADRTFTSLNANAAVTYPVRVVLLIFTEYFCRLLIYHGYSFAGLFSVFTTNNQQDDQDEQDEQDERIENLFEIKLFQSSFIWYYASQKWKRCKEYEVAGTGWRRVKKLQPLSNYVRLPAPWRCVWRHQSAIRLWFHSAVIFQRESTSPQWIMAERHTRAFVVSQHSMRF